MATSGSANSNPQVLIAGAGPVGLTLAIDLGRRGVRCLLIEEQVDPRKLPKMERVNMRSMEMYRRMGLADAIREAGAPETARMDSCIAVSMAEAPLHEHLKARQTFVEIDGVVQPAPSPRFSRTVPDTPTPPAPPDAERALEGWLNTHETQALRAAGVL